MTGTLENLTLDEIKKLMTEMKREIKRLRKELSSIRHMIDKSGLEMVCDDDAVITVYTKYGHR